MNSLRRRIDRFCVLHPNFGIPNLMLYIVIGNIAFYLLSLFSSLNNTSFYSILSFSWAGLKQGQLWRLLSFSFLPTDTRPFWLLVSCYFYYWIGSTLEREWGTAKFTIYYLSGVLLTALGAVITYTPNIKSMVFTVAGALVLLMGLRMAGILPGLRSTETELPGACSLNARTRRRFAGRPLIIGLLTGVMPCGALSAMWLCAMSSGSAARGALVMLVFSLGTVPLLFLFGALLSFLPRGWMKYIVKGSAVLVVTLGLSMLVKGIRLFGM